MKITEVRLHRLLLPLDPPFEAAWDPVPRASHAVTIVEVATDEGLVGIGSGDSMDGFEPYTPLFVGKDPLAIAHHVRVLESLSFHGGRYWPLEVALWDILGQVSGLAVGRLLGGARSSIPAYVSTGATAEPAERAQACVSYLEHGFRAVKIRLDPRHLSQGLATVAAVRDAVGERMEIMVDLNQGWRMPGDASFPLDPMGAVRIAASLADLGVLWLEEPLAESDVAGMAWLRARSGVRIAGGEMAREPADLLAYLDSDALDVYQPDAVLAGGISRCRTVAELALAKGRWFTPHTWTNGIGLLANLHVVLGVGGGPYFEFPYDPPAWTPARRDFMLKEPLEVDLQGLVHLPATPGIGAALDTEALIRYRID